MNQPLTHEQEVALVVAFQSGDHAAFHQLRRRYQPTIDHAARTIASEQSAVSAAQLKARAEERFEKVLMEFRSDNAQDGMFLSNFIYDSIRLSLYQLVDSMNPKSAAIPKISREMSVNEELLHVLLPMPFQPKTDAAQQWRKFKIQLDELMMQLDEIHNIFKIAKDMEMPAVCFSSSELLDYSNNRVTPLIVAISRISGEVWFRDGLSFWKSYVFDKLLPELRSTPVQNRLPKLTFSKEQFEADFSALPELGDTQSYFAQLNQLVRTLLHVIRPMDFITRVFPNGIVTGMIDVNYLEQSEPYFIQVTSLWTSNAAASTLENVHAALPDVMAKVIQETQEFEMGGALLKQPMNDTLKIENLPTQNY